jgi:Alpha-mannosidase
MGIMSNEFRDRVKHWERTLKDDFYLPLGPIAFEGYALMDHITPAEAEKGHFKPVKEGLEWGRTWEYMWLKSTITLPEEAKGQVIVMNLDVGGEATLFVNDKAFGTRRAEWVNVPHHYMVDNFLTQKGVPGETYSLLFEAYAGHYFPDIGGCATGPVLPGSYQDPLIEGKRAKIGRNTYGVWNEDAYQLWLDVSMLSMLFEQLDDASLRKSHIADALEKFTLMVDFEQDALGRIKDYRAARKMLKPTMQAHNGSTVGKLYAVGNAHLDLCWLWPQKETHRKTARTFAQQLRLIDKYPDYKYIQSQPAAYEMCRKYYPELYERIKKAVKAGRWIAEGGMYVEPDTNMASGEALIRQLLLGKAFYKDELGVDSRLLWLPDTFGYTAALPQILKGCNVDYLVTQKIFWSYNDGDQFPYHYFTWRGMDGSEVTSFLPTSYTYRTDPKELCNVWNSRVQKRHLEDFLIPFGYGDGGGGPCADHIEYALRAKDLEGMPKVEIESPVTMFEDLEKKGGPDNTWEGELYFSAHRGTYTAQAAIKRNNRKSEIALREAELWGALAMQSGHAYDDEAMTRLWKLALLQQFHDILPGSSIAKVYVEANQEHAALQKEAKEIFEAAQKALVKKGDGITVFNSLPFERKAIVDLEGFKNGAQTKEGATVPVFNGKALVTLPAMGAVSIMPSKEKAKAQTAKAKVSARGATLENDLVLVKLNALGEVVSYRLKETGREYAQSPMNKFLLYKDVPRLFDAWDIDSNYISQPVAIVQKAEMKLLCEEGLSANIQITRQIGESTLTQTISLQGHSERVEFDTTVEWNELHRLLKVAFPVNVQAHDAINEMQFGYVERPTHRSRLYDKDRFEVCNHRYTALSDQNHGCAVLNESKYGISVNQNSMELTLLRASASPEMRADNGEHRFTYAFTAWEGPFINAPVVKEGYELNVPVTLQKGTLDAFSAFSTDKSNIILETVKPALDGSGDLILRLYESKKADTAFKLKIALPVKKAWLCDMLENNQEELAVGKDGIALTAGAFKVLTIRIAI